MLNFQCNVDEKTGTAVPQPGESRSTDVQSKSTFHSSTGTILSPTDQFISLELFLNVVSYILLIYQLFILNMFAL